MPVVEIGGRTLLNLSWRMNPGEDNSFTLTCVDIEGDPANPGEVTATGGANQTVDATVTGTGTDPRVIKFDAADVQTGDGGILNHSWRLFIDGSKVAEGLAGVRRGVISPTADDHEFTLITGGDTLTATLVAGGGGSAGDWTALVPLTGYLSGDGFADPTDAFGGESVNPMGLSWRTTADGRILVEGNVLYVASAAPGVPDAGDLIATLPEGARPVRPAAVWATQFNFDTGAVTLAAIGITPAGEIRMQAAPAPVGQLYAIRSEFDPA